MLTKPQVLEAINLVLAHSGMIVVVGMVSMSAHVQARRFQSNNSRHCQALVEAFVAARCKYVTLH